MSKRIEDIKERLVLDVKLSIEDVNWLIKQAELVQELEKKIENVMDNHTYLEGHAYEIEQQNKRYRNLLNKASDAEDLVEVWDIVDEYKVLEGDK